MAARKAISCFFRVFGQNGNKSKMVPDPKFGQILPKSDIFGLFSDQK